MHTISMYSSPNADSFTLHMQKDDSIIHAELTLSNMINMYCVRNVPGTGAVIRKFYIIHTGGQLPVATCVHVATIYYPKGPDNTNVYHMPLFLFEEV